MKRMGEIILISCVIGGCIGSLIGILLGALVRSFC